MTPDKSRGELVSAARQGRGSYLDMRKLCTGSYGALLHKIRGVAKACTLLELTASRAKLSGGRGYERVGWQVR